MQKRERKLLPFILVFYRFYSFFIFFLYQPQPF